MRRDKAFLPLAGASTGRSVRYELALYIVFAALLVIGASAAHVQSPDGYRASESQHIRQSAERILSSPEFRYFKRLKRGESPVGRGGNGFPGGGSGPGSSGGGSPAGGGGIGEGKETSGGASPPSGGGATGSSGSSGMPPIAVPAALGSLLSALAWLILIVVAGAIVFLIVMAIRNYDSGVRGSELAGGEETQGEVEPERPPGEFPTDVYLASARELAAAGEYREAIAQLLLGAMSYAERAGLIRYRRGLTQRDYLRTLRSERDRYEAMRTMVRVYEPLGFGRRTPQREHFEQSLAGYEQAFAGGTTQP